MKILPLIPAPLNVPPAGLPFNVKASAFTQIVDGNPVKLTVGNGLTVSVPLADADEHMVDGSVITTL